GEPIHPRRSSSRARTPSPIPSPARRSFTGWSSEQKNQPMKKPTRMSRPGESQRDSITQPRVASRRATLGRTTGKKTTLKGLHHDAHLGPPPQEGRDAIPLGLRDVSDVLPRVARRTRNPGLTDAIPLGLETERRRKAAVTDHPYN